MHHCLYVLIRIYGPFRNDGQEALEVVVFMGIFNNANAGDNLFVMGSVEKKKITLLYSSYIRMA